MRRKLRAGLFVATVALMAGALAWQDLAPRPVIASPVDDYALPAPGVIARFGRPGAEPPDARLARLVALTVPEGTPASAFVGPGLFRAVFDGFITLRIRDTYRFEAEGRGRVQVKVNDQLALDAQGEDLSSIVGEPVKLKKGRNRITVTYDSPESGEARFRLLWTDDKGRTEPVPPTVLLHDPSDAQFVERAELRRGRQLFAELRCINCHAGDVDLKSLPGAMPELAADAPSLNQIGSRLNVAWMAHWINDPHALRPDATMPRLFGAEHGTDPRSIDAAAFLGTLGDPADSDQAHSEEAVNAGTRLFTGLGCIACHTLDEPTIEPLRRSLRHVKAKWRPQALREFLLSPQKHYAWIKMPDFHLSEEEAAQLAAFLLAEGTAPLPHADLPPGDAARGKSLVQSSGCLSCHALDLPNESAAPGGAIFQPAKMRGCLAADDAERGTAPQFSLNVQDRAALELFLNTDESSLQQDSPVEFANRQIAALNCLACHTRDKEKDVWSSLKDEIAQTEAGLPPEAPQEGHSPYVADQTRPPLTWVGEKLHRDWMARFIAGQTGRDVRPWLESRMPAFPVRAEGLARGLVMEHGISLESQPSQEVDPELAALGRRLVGAEGFGCNSCHQISGARATGVFESQGPDFMYAAERIRRDYYDRWMRNPQALFPGTRMPQYTDVHGRTPIKDILDGDGARQFEAIWHYLAQGREISPP